VRFVIDGVAGPTVTVPNTGGWQTYTTVDAGSFRFAPGTHHQVSLQFPKGGLNANYWTATSTASGILTDHPHTISIKASNGMFVTAEDAGAAPLIANRTSVGAWEKFDVTYVGGDQIQLRSEANGLYVDVPDTGAGPLIANGQTAAGWETFHLISNADSTYSLQSEGNSRYVTSSNGTAPLMANQSAINGWEKFSANPA
jgi:hypothetical protein